MKKISISELENSKQFVKNASTFFHPVEILQDFLTTQPNLEIWASHEVSVGESEDDQLTAFGRILITSKKFEGTEISHSLGTILALDTRTPLMKIFSGSEVRACTNLCVFGAHQIDTFNLVNRRETTYKQRLNTFLDTYAETVEFNEASISELKNREISRNDLPPFYGDVLKFLVAGKSDASLQRHFINGVRNLENKNSIYFAGNKTTAWNVANAITQSITDTPSIIDLPEKTLQTFEIVKDFLY